MSALDKDIEAELKKHQNGLLAFNLKLVKEELRAFNGLARTKLTADSLVRLDRLQATLDNIFRAEPGAVLQWATSRDAPIKTKPNKGAHQPGREGKGYDLQAEIGFTWELELVGKYSRQRPANRFVVLKDSSVKVRIVEVGEGAKKECVAGWDFDLGNHQSPGCHFHAKYHEAEETRREVYSDVDIPRLPTFIFMPTDAIEFVIGELWQDDCERLAVNSEYSEWYKFAKDRMGRVFDWYLMRIKKTAGSPWMSIKTSKPEPLLLL